MDKRQRNKSIEGARAIGAVIVLLWHLNHFLDPYLSGFTLRTVFRGEWANVFFFALSGFLVSYTRNHDAELPSGYTFVKKRILTIYPLWLLTIVFFVVLNGTTLYLRNQVSFQTVSVLVLQAAVDILLIQSWIPGYPYLFEMNGPGWFLSAMLLLWLLTIPFLKIIRKWNSKQQTYVVAILLLIQSMWTWACYNCIFFEKYATGIWWMYPITSYLCGMIAGQQAHSKRVSFWESGCASFLVLSAGLVICYFVTFKMTFVEYPFLICYMLYFIRLLARGEHPICGMLSNKYMVFLGSISFEIYLLHIPITRFFEFFGFVNNGVVAFCLIILITFFMGFTWKNVMHSLRGRK